MGLAARRFFGNQQPRHQPLHFLRRQHHIAHEQADELGRLERQPRRQAQDRPRVADFLANQPHQFVEREHIRPHRVPGEILLPRPGLHCQRGQVIHIHRLDAVLPVPHLPEKRKTPQQPGNVINQHIFHPEQHRRAQDGIAQPALHHRLLVGRLAPVIRQARIRRRVGNADMHHPPRARRHRRIDQPAGIFHRARLGVPALVEAHPVGVIKYLHPGQAARHANLVEIERERLHPSAKRVGAVGVSGQGDDLVTLRQQAAGDVLPRVRKSTGNSNFHFRLLFGNINLTGGAWPRRGICDAKWHFALLQNFQDILDRSQPQAIQFCDR